MAENEIISFDELAKDTQFKFKGETYTIPSITNEKALQLFKMGKSKNLIKDGTIESADLAKEKEENTQDNEDFMEFQADFIIAAVVKSDGSQITKEELNKWPIKVCMGVVKLINECISGVVEENSTEEKK